jgi:hypothetical protein
VVLDVSGGKVSKAPRLSRHSEGDLPIFSPLRFISEIKKNVLLNYQV